MRGNVAPGAKSNTYSCKKLIVPIVSICYTDTLCLIEREANLLWLRIHYQIHTGQNKSEQSFRRSIREGLLPER